MTPPPPLRGVGRVLWSHPIAAVPRGVADARGTLRLFDRHGRTLWKTDNPRPFQHLAFVPEAPLLLGSADYGLIACFDQAGACVWRDGLVAHIGSLAVSGDGSQIVLAC